MNRTDRVLSLIHNRLDPIEAVAAGVTLQDADDAVSILRLDLELTRAERGLKTRDIVAEFLRGLAE